VIGVAEGLAVGLIVGASFLAALWLAYLRGRRDERQMEGFSR